MQIPHQTYKIDLNSINEPLTRMIESVNDKGVRFVDVELWANSQKVTLPQNSTATAAFVTDGFLISESVDCSISDDLTTVIVPIDNANIESKSGIMLVEIKITENGNILTPPFAFKVRVKKSITEDANIFEKSYGTVSEILKEVAEARGNSKTLKEEIATKADKTDVETKLSGKANKATTLAGYGITNAYTKTEVDSKVDSAAENVINILSNISNSSQLNDYTNTNKTYTFFTNLTTYSLGKELNLDKSYIGMTRCILNNYRIDGAEIQVLRVLSGSATDENKQFSRMHNNGWSTFKEITILNKSVTKEKLSDDLQIELTGKYDASNVETGSGTLTPYTTSADIVKSADFTYQRVGRVVTVNVNIVFNAGANDGVRFTNLPYVCKNTVNPRGLCVSTAKTNRIWAINRNDTMLNIISEGSSASYTDGETLAFMLSYLVS